MSLSNQGGSYLHNAQYEAIQDEKDFKGALPARLTSVEVRFVGKKSEDKMQHIVNEALSKNPDPEKLIIFATHPMSAALVEQQDGATLLQITLAPGAPQEEIQSLVQNLANLHDIYTDLSIQVTDLEERDWR